MAPGRAPENLVQRQNWGMSRMSTHTIRMNDEIDEYLLRVSLRESDLQRRLREETATLEYGGMQVSPCRDNSCACWPALSGRGV